jgi:hypothetical protein
MGVVYRAHDKRIDRAVAIKVMRVDPGASTRESVELRQRGRVRGLILRRLLLHVIDDDYGHRALVHLQL